MWSLQQLLRPHKEMKHKQTVSKQVQPKQNAPAVTGCTFSIGRLDPKLSIVTTLFMCPFYTLKTIFVKV